MTKRKIHHFWNSFNRWGLEFFYWYSVLCNMHLHLKIISIFIFTHNRYYKWMPTLLKLVIKWGISSASFLLFKEFKGYSVWQITALRFYFKNVTTIWKRFHFVWYLPMNISILDVNTKTHITFQLFIFNTQFDWIWRNWNEDSE